MAPDPVQSSPTCPRTLENKNNNVILQDGSGEMGGGLFGGEPSHSRSKSSKKLTKSSAGDSDEESGISPILYNLNFSYHGYGSDVPGPWFKNCRPGIDNNPTIPR